MHKLVAIGCGPGDPELLTVKAANAIREADVIACPTAREGKTSMALEAVSTLVDDSRQRIIPLIFPMTRDRDTLEETWRENARILAEAVAANERVVYLTIGDPYLYSTWIYMHRELNLRHPEVRISVIPGIVSMFTFASKVGVSLAEGAEKMSVIPSCYDLGAVAEIARNSDTLVFLKDGRYFDRVIGLLREAGFADSSIFAIGQDLGTDHEIIRKITLGEADSSALTTKYFSILVVKRA
jgi:precorrin-2/cobalt-factor-2 C20-methyltransferase